MSMYLSSPICVSTLRGLGVVWVVNNTFCSFLPFHTLVVGSKAGGYMSICTHLQCIHSTHSRHPFGTDDSFVILALLLGGGGIDTLEETGLKYGFFTPHPCFVLPFFRVSSSVIYCCHAKVDYNCE